MAEDALQQPDVGGEPAGELAGAALGEEAGRHLEQAREDVAAEPGDGALAGVHLFFPDPWRKKRHFKRRIVQADFVALIAQKLAPGGYFHCATDWEDYAHWMLEVISAEPALQNTADGFAPRPDYRPLTKFENRGLKLGHGVWDLVFRRRSE